MKNIILTLLVTCNLALAYDEEEVMNNLAGDYAECAAYSSVVSDAVLKKDKALSDSYLKLSLRYLQFSAAISNVETAEARFKLNYRNQYKLIDNNFNNISRLMVKYTDFCVELNNNPEKRIQYWRQQTD